MAKKTINKKENIKDTVLDTEKTENIENTSLDIENDEDTENTILDAEKKDSDIIRKAFEEDASKEEEQTPTITSEEEVEQPKPIEENVENEDLQSDKKNSEDKVNTAKHKISKLFGYYWNGQLMD